jgi:thioredoxin 1
MITQESASTNALYRTKPQLPFRLLLEMNSMTEGPVHLTDANFDETIQKNPLVLVDFWAGWCGPCRALAPTIEELAKEFAGKVLIAKLEVDENPVTAEKFNVSSIPTVVILKDCCEVEKIIGLCNKQRYADALKKQM